MVPNPLEPIATTPPSDPTYYRYSEPSDNGEIGCDYLMQEYQVEDVTQWTTFEISRKLPLPSKKGTKSAEITTSTAKAHLNDMTTTQ